MIKSVRLTNIRCFEDRTFEFSPGINLVVGPNGSGKTTILEALAMFSYGRFQSIAQDFFAVKKGEEVGRIEIEANIQERLKNLEAAILEHEKVIKINGKKVRRSKIIGFLKIIYFNPETIDLVAGRPETRRRELDLTIAQKRSRYVYELLDFRRILRQRNNLLKRIGLSLARREELGFWDGQLTTAAVEIYKKRVELLALINKGIKEVHNLLIEKERELNLRYEPSADYEKFADNLAATEDRDIVLGQTTVGPHRDDFVFLDRDFALKEGGSRGEQRMAAIAFKVETKKYLADGFEPILVLDDVFSELDKNRRESVSKIFGDGQVIISATDERVIPEKVLGCAKVIKL